MPFFLNKKPPLQRPLLFVRPNMARARQRALRNSGLQLPPSINAFRALSSEGATKALISFPLGTRFRFPRLIRTSFRFRERTDLLSYSWRKRSPCRYHALKISVKQRQCEPL